MTFSIRLRANAVVRQHRRMQTPWTRRLTVALGAVYTVLGSLEVILRLKDPDIGAMAFLGGTQLVGAALIFGGLFGPVPEALRRTVIIVGAVAGLVATFWTVMIPILGIAVIALNMRDASRPPSPPATRLTP